MCVMGLGLRRLFSSLKEVRPTKKESPLLVRRRVTSEQFPRLQKQLIELSSTLSDHKELSDAVTAINELIEDLTKPMLVVVMGQFNTGKSTFINCLLKERRLVSDVRPATAAVTALSYGAAPKLIVHKTDGSEAAFPIAALAEVSAEGNDRGRKIREDLSYLEVQLPAELLKSLTLIDTPGLNSTNVLHTKATSDFSRRADMVIWLLAAGQAGTASEDQDIKRLAKDLNPIVVVNQIDQFDEEEESIDDALSRIGKRLGLSKAPFGISASTALAAIEESDPELLQASGWQDFESKLTTMLSDDAMKERGKRISVRFESAIKQCFDILKQLTAQRKEVKANADGGESMLRNQENAINDLEDCSKKWQAYLQQLKKEINALDRMDFEFEFKSEEAGMLSRFPTEIESRDKLLQQWKILMANGEAVEADFKKLQRDFEEFNPRADEFDRQRIAHEKHLERFNKKFFLEQMLSFTEREQMDKTADSLNSQASTLKVEAEFLQSRLKSACLRGARLGREMLTVGEEVENSIKAAISSRRTLQKNHKSVTQEAQKRLLELAWLDDTELMLTQVRGMCQDALSADLQPSSTSSSAQADDAGQLLTSG